MKKFLIVIGDNNHLGKYNEFLTNIKKLFKEEFYYTYIDQLTFSIVKGQVSIYDLINQKELKSFDLVYFYRWKYSGMSEVATCAYYLKNHKVNFINKNSNILAAQSKAKDSLIMALNGLSVPDMVFSLNQGILNELRNKFNIQFPLLLKDIKGSKGKNIYLVKNEDNLLKILKNNENIKFLIQEYIPNKFDFRTLVLGDKVGCTYKRTRQSDQELLNHAFLGAKEEEVILKKKTIEKNMIKAAKLLDLQIAGVDYIYDEKNSKQPALF